MEIIKAGSDGIYLPQLNIGLDYSGSDAEYVFVSHGHSDHIPRRSTANTYATRPTKKFMKLRNYRGQIEELNFGNSLETDTARITFYPAGHILGSAMTFIESDFGNLLYTGDYRSPASPASEGFQLPKEAVDYFITEATFSLPIYRWKSYTHLEKQICSFASNALNEGYTPIFLAYNLGKAQEIMHFLKNLNHPVQIHNAGFKLCDVYEQEGIDLGQYETYDHDTCKGKILITPGSALGNGFASNIKKKRIAYCSGWAAMEARRVQMTVDKLIPLSDHLDFFELIRLCEKLNPKKTYITHTPNPNVVLHYLEKRGIAASTLKQRQKTA
ncbi:MAG: hypothetical protein FH748_17135 [Balneolaceae bacterium]|nr:hypothetical protein [Balneolaceae bacterium]